MNVLVVAAHPDDEVLGCGGTAARLSAEGADVYLAILGEGSTARARRREDADRGEIDVLRKQSQQAAERLGGKQVFHYDLPDNRFDTVPMLEVVKIVEALVDRLQPVAVYTHHGGDLNVDHVAVHRAVLTATRPIPGHPVRDVYAFEVPSSTEWAFQRFQPFHPTVFVEISRTLGAKKDALACYADELRAFPHPRSFEAVEALARRWGSAVGCEAAEAFELVRTVRRYGEKG